jgi:uncharacterized membrane protein YhfC
MGVRTTQTAGAFRRRPPLWYFTTAATLAVGILPIWALESWFGVPRKIIVGYGFLAYIVGVTLIKMPLYHFIVERALRPRLSNPALAGTQGVLSAASELSAAAAFFVYVIPQPSYWQLVGFGVGAGAVEAIMLPFVSNPFKGGTLGEHAEGVFRASARAQGVQWLSVLERIWAMLLQVSTRGLVYLSVASHNPIPACIALAGFSVVDGSAYYWHLKKWRFDSLPILARVHAFLGLMACLMTAAFLWWSGHFSFEAA